MIKRQSVIVSIKTFAMALCSTAQRETARERRAEAGCMCKYLFNLIEQFIYTATNQTQNLTILRNWNMFLTKP